MATHQPGGSGGEGRGIGLQSDGSIIVAGNYSNGGNFDLFLVRFSNDVTTGLSAAPAQVLRAFPSPCTGSFTVAGTVAGGMLTLHDAMGHAVHTLPTTEGRTEVQADVPAGVYTLMVRQRSGEVAALRVVRE